MELIMSAILIGILLNAFSLAIVNVFQSDILNECTDRFKVGRFKRMNHDWWSYHQKYVILPYLGAFYSLIWYSRFRELIGLGYSGVDSLLIISKEEGK